MGPAQHQAFRKPPLLRDEPWVDAPLHVGDTLTHEEWLESKYRIYDPEDPPLAGNPFLFRYAAGDSISALGGTFSRASTATYTDADGVIQTAAVDTLRDGHYVNHKTNLLLRSQDTGNSVWGATAENNTTNAIDPLGGTSPCRVDWSGSAAPSNFYQTIIGLTPGNHTKSVWLRADTAGGTVKLGNPYWGAGPSYVVTLTTTWTRYSLTENTPGTGDGLWIQKASDSPSVIYAWGAQLETGSTASPYIATTSAPVTKSFTRTTLLEGARTNLATYSQDFSDVSWLGGNASLTHGLSDPSGGVTATTLTVLGSPGYIYKGATPLPDGDGQYTVAIWIRRRTGSGVVNLITPEPSGRTAIAVTDSWLRYTATATSVGEIAYIGVEALTIGDAVDIAFAQLEAGSFASSYIPTTSAAVTRAAESLSFPFTAPPQEMSVYARVIPEGLTDGAAVVNVGSTGDNPRILFYTSANYDLYYGGVAASAGAIVSGVSTELCGVVTADGHISISKSVDEAAEVTGAQAGTPLPTAWSVPILTINDFGGTKGFHAFRNLIIAKGTRDMAWFRSKL